MYLTIIFLPLMGSIISGLFGRMVGGIGACRITVFCLVLTFFFSFTAFYEVALAGSPVYVKLFTWIDSELFNADWGFLFDTLTVVMCCVVTSVSSLVHLYSTEYMSHDPHLPRFMSYLSLFTFFMLILVTADNYIQMFVGWEGVGLCSFLLINFWFTRIQANKAAIKAMIVNRIGDFALALGILTIFIKFRAVDYATVFAITPIFRVRGDTLNFLNFDFDLLTVISILLFLGAVGKSAQLGLHIWLPIAMEGPTPVSALIHAATMVTAGVFLIARSSPIFEFAPNALAIVTTMGAMTCFFAASTGLLQNDLKRVIAYSTCSQLGYMVFACGLSNYSVGIFHLANHAYFKALLFLGAGSVIHAVSDEQDMRKMGGLKKLVPFTYSVMMVGSLALMGFPFLTGFYSKDVILEVAYGHFSIYGHFSYFLGTLAAFCTAFYSLRLVYLTFLSEPNGYRPVIIRSQDSAIRIVLPLFLLVIPSIFIGYFLKDMFIGMGTDFWGNSLYVMPENLNSIDSEFIPTVYKLLPVFFSMCGAGCSYLFYRFGSSFLYSLKTSFIGKIFYNFLSNKWFFDKVYNEFIVQKFLAFSYHISYKTVDKGMLEIIGPTGLSKLALKVAFDLQRLQTGFLYHYIGLILISLVFFITVIRFGNVIFQIINLKFFILCLISIFVMV